MLDNIPGDIVLLEEEMVLRGKMDICDLAGSERLGKTMVEGINRYIFDALKFISYLFEAK